MHLGRCDHQLISEVTCVAGGRSWPKLTRSLLRGVARISYGVITPPRTGLVEPTVKAIQFGHIIIHDLFWNRDNKMSLNTQRPSSRVVGK